jgi:hypothetical protein
VDQPHRCGSGTVLCGCVERLFASLSSVESAGGVLVFCGGCSCCCLQSAEDDTLISVDRYPMRITTMQKFEVRRTLGSSYVIYCTCKEDAALAVAFLNAMW